MSDVPDPKTTPGSPREGADPDDAGTPRAEFLNRELSWLEFNRRVLFQALDGRTPLLERVRFLGIFTSNLDEFFMKRVGGLKRQIAAGLSQRSVDGRTSAEQLAEVREAVLPMLRDQAESWQDEIRPALREHDVHLLRWEELAPEERAEATSHFRSHVFPVLTPLAVDPGHPFPFISNLSQSLGIMLRHPEQDERLFARVKIPDVLPQWIKLDSARELGRFRFLSLIELIQHHVGELFREMEIMGVMPFRITRNADIERDEEDAEDLLELIEEELRARRFASVVRLEHGPDPNPWILRFLVGELELTEQDVYELPYSEMDYTGLGRIADLPLPHLQYEPWTPQVPPMLADDQADIFAVIRAGDLMVHHPYESFAASVERLIAAAADDPRVLAIKMTLYRTGDDSPFIPMLIRAAESGKQVVCLVELKARFDEQRNIQCAQTLENAGVHVVYGIMGLKTHTKTALVVREELEGPRCYVHAGTGNYHAGTARLYTDLGLFTATPDFSQDMVELFHYLTGRSMKTDYRKFLIAPVNMRARFLAMISREVENARAGRPAQIVAKMNSLEDRQIIRALYEASQAGVSIDLVIRGFCCLRPGVGGMSEGIRVTSVIGRFLEHSRIFFFRNGQSDPLDGEYYIGSADWMYRNLESRVEAIVPIEDRALRERCWSHLEIILGDHRQAWDMQPDGTYVLRHSDDPGQIGTHEIMMQRMLLRCRGEVRFRADP